VPQELQARAVQQVRKGSQVFLDSSEREAYPEIRATQAIRVEPDLLEALDGREPPGLAEVPAQRDGREIQAVPEIPVFLVILVIQVALALQGRQGRPVRQDSTDRGASLGPEALVERLDPKVLLDSPDTLVPMDRSGTILGTRERQGLVV